MHRGVLICFFGKLTIFYSVFPVITGTVTAQSGLTDFAVGLFHMYCTCFSAISIYVISTCIGWAIPMNYDNNLRKSSNLGHFHRSRDHCEFVTIELESVRYDVIQIQTRKFFPDRIFIT